MSSLAVPSEKALHAEKQIAEALVRVGAVTLFAAHTAGGEELNGFFKLAAACLARSLTGDFRDLDFYPYACTSPDVRPATLLFSVGGADAQEKLIETLGASFGPAACRCIRNMPPEMDELKTAFENVQAGRYRLLEVDLGEYRKDLDYTRMMGRAPTLGNDELAQRIDLRLSSVWLAGDKRTQQALVAMAVGMASASAKTKQQRKEQGLCVMCGRKLGWIDRSVRRESHAGCNVYVSDEERSL